MSLRPFGQSSTARCGALGLALLIVLSTAIRADLSRAAAIAVENPGRIVIRIATCTPTLNTSTCQVTTSVPSRLSVGLSADGSYALRIQDSAWSSGHVFTVRGLDPATTYKWLVQATPKSGKSVVVVEPSFNTLAAGSQASMTTRGSRILMNGVPWMPILANMNTRSDCHSVEALTQALAIHANVIDGGIEGCYASHISDPLGTTIAGKAWFTDYLFVPFLDHPPGAAGNPTRNPVDQQASFIGWDQPIDPEVWIPPADLPPTPQDGKLTFEEFGYMFWSGETPPWTGYQDPIPATAPPWNAATAKAYFSTASVLGFTHTRFAYATSGCAKRSLAPLYSGMRSLVTMSGKPTLTWVDISSYGCPPYSAVDITSQIYLGIEGGASGIGIVDQYDGITVSSSVSTTMADTLGRIETLWPCLATGAATTVGTSSTDVKARACRYSGATYVLATSTGAKPLTAQLTVRGHAGKGFRLVGRPECFRESRKADRRVRPARDAHLPNLVSERPADRLIYGSRSGAGSCSCCRSRCRGFEKPPSRSDHCRRFH